MSRSVAKYFRIHPVLKQRFERFCGALGLNESQVLEKLISDWCEQQKDQVRLDIYVPNGNIIINQPQQVNIAIKAELTYCKLELSRVLGILDSCSEESRPDFLKNLAKIIVRASRIQGATEDQELGDLLARAEAHLG